MFRLAVQAITILLFRKAGREGTRVLNQSEDPNPTQPIRSTEGRKEKKIVERGSR